MSGAEAQPRAPDIPAVAGLAITVLFVGAHATDRTGEALEWRLYLLLGTVLPALLLVWALALRRWPHATWTTAAHAFFVVVAVAAAAWRAGVAFDPRAALMAAICTGAAAFSATRRSDLAAPIDWRRQFIDPIVFFAVMLAACHGFLGIVWWTTDPKPIGPAVLQVSWLVALTLGLCWLVDRVPARPRRLDRVLFALGAVVVLAASLRIPDFHRQDDRTWHHWGAIASPAEMVRDGGALLWDVPSQYGFLSTLSLAWLPVGNSWEALRIVQAGALAGSALLILALLLAVRPGIGFAAALPLTLCAVFLLPGDAEGLWGPFTVPSMGSFRFVWVYAMLAVAWWESRATSPKASWLVGTTVFTLGCLWSVESAAYCIATWIPALAWSRWHLARRDGSRVRATGLATGALLLPAAVLASVVIAIRVAYGQILGVEPDFRAYFEYAASFVQIYAALPIEPGGPFVGVMALFATVSASLVRAFARANALDTQVVGLAAFGATWSTTSYFVSSSRAETADSVMPVWLAAIALIWLASEREGAPWRVPMARWLVAAWGACLLYAATSEPARLGPFARDLATDPLTRLTPEMPKVGGALSRLLREAGATTDDRVVLVYPNALQCYDSTPGAQAEEVLVPNPVWLPLAPLLRPLSEERQRVYLDRLAARGLDRGWYIRLKDQPFLGRGYLWKYHLEVEARTVATEVFEDDLWIVEWREPAPGAP